MTTRTIDLERYEREEMLRDEIDALDAKFRASDQIGDLVRLRDGRVRCGLADMRESEARAQATPRPVGGSGKVAEIEFADTTPPGFAAAFHRAGVVILRNVFPARRALELRKHYDAALAAGRAMIALEKDSLPDLRHADEKEIFVRPDRKTGVPHGHGQEAALDNGVVMTFMSPRITLEIHDFLTLYGLQNLMRHALDDEVRLSFENSILHAVTAAGLGLEADRGATIWIPLFDCGEGTQRPGLEIYMVGQSDKSGASITVPFIAAGDVVVFKNSNSKTISYGDVFTGENIAVSLQVLTRADLSISDTPVFW